MPAEEKDARGKVEGKAYIWTTEDGDTVTIPLRIKLKVLRAVGTSRAFDATEMFAMLELLIPDQTEVLDEMDVNDFTEMFSAWQTAYNESTGAQLGESSSSSA